MLTLIEDAGWPIWPLLVASIVTLAVIIERMMSLRRSRILPAGLEDQVQDMVARQQVTPDALKRLERHSPLGAILADVLRFSRDDDTRRRAAIEDTGRAISFDLGRYIGVLSTLAVAAPLMGLFGTVIGMIEIFGSFSPVGGDPTALARGIGIALYNTALGILIAIVCLFAHRGLRARADRLVFDLEAAAVRLSRHPGAGT